MCLNFEIWKEVLTKPQETFKKQEKKANLGEGIKHIGIAGVIVGVITGIAAWIGMATVGSLLGTPGLTLGVGIGIAAFLSSVILTPIFAVIWWLIGSGILYIFAMIFGGKGSYTTQSYLIALYSAPLMILSAILVLIPIVGAIVNFLVMLYGLYLLTLALKQVHKVTTGKAVAIWFVPLVIVVIIIAVMFSVWLATFTTMLTAGKVGSQM